MKKNLCICVFLIALFCITAFAQDTVPPETEIAPVSEEPAPPPAAEPESAPPVPPEPAPIVVPPAPPTPEAPAVQTPAPVVAESEPSESSFKESSFKLGLRMGIGASQFRKHVALRIQDNNSGSVKLNPAIAFSAGIASDICFNSVFSIAPELQYSLYRANYEVIKKQPKTFDETHHIGVYLQTVELPIFLRFRFGGAYTEVGPQVGLNLHSNIYKNANYYRPDLNLLALSVAGGAGANIMGSTLVGIRGHFGFLEYAKDAKGIPWSVQLGISQFIF